MIMIGDASRELRSLWLTLVEDEWDKLILENTNESDGNKNRSERNRSKLSLAGCVYIIGRMAPCFVSDYIMVMTLLQPAVFYSSCTAAPSYRPDCNKRHAARPRAADWSHILRILGTEEPAPSGDHSFHPLTLPLYFICSPSL